MESDKETEDDNDLGALHKTITVDGYERSWQDILFTENRLWLDHRTLRLVVHQMIEAALFWWDSMKETIDPLTLTWTEFKVMFELKFMPATKKAKRAEQFMKLEQGDMIVNQYFSRFNELSHYAKYLVDTIEKKNDSFIKGLRPELKK